MDNVIKCTVMLADIKEWADMNTVYGTFFKKERMPARSSFGRAGLSTMRGSRIECMARSSRFPGSAPRCTPGSEDSMDIDRRGFLAALGGAAQ